MPGLVSVRVAECTATLSGESCTAVGVPLVEGDNALVAEARTRRRGSSARRRLVVTLDSLPPDVAFETRACPSSRT